ncbi:MAG: helix-turn-helix domain-containing protein [Oscillospiraceae bacterium]|nr:helix-turn-helix domain-containing protein [Oscillospiraceae bacterium]
MTERIRALREDKDLKQKELANYLNVDQSTYSDYETGKLNIPVAVLIKLSVYYNTSTDYILNLTDNQKPYERKKRG